MLTPVKVGYDSVIRYGKTTDSADAIPQDIAEAKYCRA
jgi:hypothetical protein